MTIDYQRLIRILVRGGVEKGEAISLVANAYAEDRKRLQHEFEANEDEEGG